MEPAGDVCYRNQRQQRGIVAEAINAEPLAHVAVDDGHATLLLLLWPGRGQGSHSMAHHAGWLQALSREYTSSWRLTVALPAWGTTPCVRRAWSRGRSCANRRRRR